MKIGPYRWDIEPELMGEEEFQYLCEGIEAAKAIRKLNKFQGKMLDLLREAQAEGVRFLNHSALYNFTVITPSTFEVEEAPQEKEDE